MAFPTTPILDNFNRANTGPPPSVNWATPIFPGHTGLKVLSNLLVAGVASFCDSYWSATKFNANQEVYATLAIKGANISALFTRLSNPGLASITGYFLYLDVVNSLLQIYRMDNSTTAVLLNSLAHTFVNGERFGFTSIGKIHTGYMDTKNGKGFSFALSASDATYSNSGYLGVQMGDATPALDDFGGGASRIAPYPMQAAVLGT